MIQLSALFFVLIFTIVLTYGLEQSYATSHPIIFFDQDKIVINHGSVITYVDPNITNTEEPSSIIAEISNGTNVDNVILDYQGNGVFTSNFVMFVSDNVQNTDFQQIEVDVGNNVIVTINGIDDVATIVRDNYLSSELGLNSFELLNGKILRGCSGDNGIDGDRDGICDNWEKEDMGIKIIKNGIEYAIPCGPHEIDEICPSPNRKDIYLKIDYMEGHKPNPIAIEQVEEAFDKHGIVLHVFVEDDAGIPHVSGITKEGTGDNSLAKIKAKYFGTDTEKQNKNWYDDGAIPGIWQLKNDIFHYALFAHQQKGDLTSSGIAELRGNDIIISLGSFAGNVGSVDQQAGTLMHELGHNLGLNHGGNYNDSINCKPNYISVMSYSRQFSDLVPDRKLDYSSKAIGEGNSVILPQPPTIGIGLGSYTENNVHASNEEDIIFGYQDGIISTPLQKTGNNNIDWGDSDILYIKDKDGNVVCEKGDISEDLLGHDDWSSISLERGRDRSADWSSGRGLQQVSTESSNTTIQIPNRFSFKGCQETHSCFSPTEISIIKEDQVTWVNLDKDTHNIVVRTNDKYPTDIFQVKLPSNKEASFKFENNGEYEYFCNIHPWMKGGKIYSYTTEEYEKIIKDIGLMLDDKSCLDDGKISNLDFKGKDLIPLCPEEEIKKEHVQAARSVRTDMLLNHILTTSHKAFYNQEDFKQRYDDKIAKVKDLVSSDKIIEAKKIIRDMNLRTENGYGFIADRNFELVVKNLDNIQLIKEKNNTVYFDELSNIPVTDFHEPESIKQIYTENIGNIQKLVLQDDIVTAIQEYEKLRETYDLLGDDDLIKDPNAKKIILQIHDANVRALQKVVTNPYTNYDFYELFGKDIKIPDWVRTNAKWWVSGEIDDSSFVEGIQYLIKQGIIQISR